MDAQGQVQPISHVHHMLQNMPKHLLNAA
jgi:hypothetical protein